MGKQAFKSPGDPCVGVSAFEGRLCEEHQTLVACLRSHAHNVSVIIDPQAGINAEDPNADQAALRDVEAALDTWGCMTPFSDKLRAQRLEDAETRRACSLPRPAGVCPPESGA